MNTKFNKLIFVITVVSIIITAISIGFNYLLPMYLSKTILDESKSIAIIGGADGPTSIFISSNPNAAIYTYIFLIIGIIGSIYLIKTKNKK